MTSAWERPRTSRVYLHAPGAGRILLLQPDFKLTALDLQFVPRHTRQDACGVHLLCGLRETGPLDFRQTVFDRPQGGLPIWTIRGTDPENGCTVRMTALATDDAEPVVYARVTIVNPGDVPAAGRIGLLPRSVKNADHYLTGLWDTGYESYQPNWHQWLLQRAVRVSETSAGTASAANGKGVLRLLGTEGFTVRWISREEQTDRFRAHDYYACDYTLGPHGSLTLDFAFSAGASLPVTLPGFDDALARMTAYWRDIQSRVTTLPQTDDPGLCDLFRQNVTQCLQMIARYDGLEGLVCRQGDVGRFLWAYEAAHVLSALDRVGFSDLTFDVYKTMVGMVPTEGEERGRLQYRWVSWDNAESAILWGIGEHLRCTKDASRADFFRPYVRAMLDYIEARRHTDDGTPWKGLYPAGVASDWGEVGKHWTFTDAFAVRGITRLAEALEALGDRDAAAVRAVADDYRAAVVNVMTSLYAGHEQDEAYILPHIAGIDFEDSWNHCFYTDGAPYLSWLGILDPKSRIFEQMEAFYVRNGLFEHGLAGRMTNATDFGVGVYGDCYYTGISELCWIYPWMARGEWDKVEAAAAALLTYNVTPEYIVSERYCSFDPWYTPWQPNGSGSGRIVEFLLDYCAAKRKE